LLAIGAYLVFTTLRSMRKPTPDVAQVSVGLETTVDDDDLRRVEEELKRLQ